MQLAALFRSTPVWVWVLFAALVALGLAQLRDREVGLTRLRVLPLLFAALSANGTAGAFGATLPIVATWLTAAACSFFAGKRLVAIRGASAVTARPDVLRVPGSAIPLVLMMALFAIKYGVGASLALHPALAGDPTFAVASSALYGAFAGLFLARGASVGLGGGQRLAAAGNRPAAPTLR